MQRKRFRILSIDFSPYSVEALIFTTICPVMVQPRQPDRISVVYAIDFIVFVDIDN
jgi:hypothetical protein